MRAVGNDELTRRELFNEVELECHGLLYETVIRHKCNAKADAGKVDQKIVAAKLNLRHQIELKTLKLAVQELTRCTFSVEHQNRVLQKFL